MTQSKLSEIIESAYTYEVRRWATEFGIPEENLRFDSQFVSFRDEMLACVECSMIAMRDGAKTKTEQTGSIPASLKDWLKIYLKRWLPMWLGSRVTYKTIPLNKVTHETWNLCPHHRADRAGCLRFMVFGTDFTKLSADARRLAEDIVEAAIRIPEESDRMFPSGRLMGAVMRYRELNQIRKPVQ